MKKLLNIANLLLAVILFSIIITGTNALTTTNYTSNTTVNLSSNTTFIFVEMWGGGGGGGGGGGFPSGGGGGGGYSSSVFLTPPNTNLTLKIGKGGTSGTATSGTTGETTSLNTSTYFMYAYGGTGVAYSGLGPTAGGRGGNGTIRNGVGGNGSINSGGGGGGGGGAGTLTDGSMPSLLFNGTGALGGTLYGGNGGNGGIKIGSGGIGTNGSIYGGGGGGGTTGTGGGGGAGGITIKEYNSTDNYGFLVICIYNESSLLLANGTNFTVTINNINNTYIYSTITGNVNTTEMIGGVYSILISGSPYKPRQYIATVQEISNLNAYVTTSTSTTLFTIKDGSNSMGVENAIATMSTSLSGSYTTVESKFSDVTGSAQFNYIPFTLYRFAISKAGYSSIVFYLNPVLLSAYTIQLVPSSTASLNYDNIGIVLTPTSFYNDRQNNLTFTISSPDGVLSSYGVNVSYPSGWVDDAGINVNGETFNLQFNTSATTSAFDTVNITYYFTSVNTGYHEYNLTYSIRGGVAMGSFLRNQAERFGLGDFEAVLIATIFILLVAGATTYFGGSLIGGVIGLFMMGYFFYIGLLPLWSIILSMLAGFVFISWRSTA